MDKSIKFSILILLLFLSINIFAQDNERGKLDALNQKIQKGESSSKLYLERGKIYDKQDNFEKSNADFKQVIKNYESGNDKDAESALQAYYHLADDHMYRNSDASNALKYVVKGLDIDPDNKALLLIKAEALYRIGQNEKSFAIYESLLNDFPKDLDVLTEYALKLEKRDVHKAKDLYEKVLTVDVSNKRALYFLGMYFTRLSNGMNQEGKHPKEVRPVMEKGVNYLAEYYKQSPEDEAAKESLIEFYEYLGEDEKAAELKK